MLETSKMKGKTKPTVPCFRYSHCISVFVIKITKNTVRNLSRASAKYSSCVIKCWVTVSRENILLTGRNFGRIGLWVSGHLPGWNRERDQNNNRFGADGSLTGMGNERRGIKRALGVLKGCPPAPGLFTALTVSHGLMGHLKQILLWLFGSGV